MNSRRAGQLFAIGSIALVALAALTLLDGIWGVLATAGLVASYALLSVSTIRAMARVRTQAETTQHLALHDPVTELANRVLFHDRAAQAIARARRRNHDVGILLLDLNRFKEINDTLGHHSGDLLLYRIGERLSSTLRGSDSVARLGGDEFAVLLPEVMGEAGAMRAAKRIETALTERIEIQGVTLEIEAAMGVAISPEHGDDPDLLLQRADIAMYWSKDRHNGIEIYAGDRDEHSRERLELIGELRQAIDDEELVVYFQPKADLRQSSVVGVEALVRWDHPARGFLPPDTFIPLAESTGLIGPLTHYVLDASLRQARHWREEGIDLSMAVNLSTRNLLDLSLPDAVAELLEAHEVPAEKLELEVTETMMMGDPIRSAEVLNRLSELGVKVAIDDFGTGYTSLSWLKRLPIDTLKIDRSFVMGMEEAGDDSVIVRSTINLARDLGLGVVAEGIESAQAWEELAALGCDLAQGYLLSRPLPSSDITPWLRERRRSDGGAISIESQLLAEPEAKSAGGATAAAGRVASSLG